jgi:hypothetical protein
MNMPPDDLKSPQEKFGEAIVQMDDVGNFRRGVSISTFVGFGVAMFFLISANPFGDRDYTFLVYFLLSVAVGIGVGFLYSRIAAKAYGFVRRPAAPRQARGATGTSPPSTSAPAVTRRAMPRLANMRAVSDEEVLNSSFDEMITSFAVRGGRSERTSEPSVGVFVPTIAGIAFLPDIEPLTLKTLRQSKPLIWGIAKEMIPGADLLEVAEIVRSEDHPEAKFDMPSWLAKSRARKDHFVIPWPELVEVKVEPAKKLTTLVREGPDGKRSTYMLETSEPQLADALIQRRVHFEVMDLFLQLVINPRRAELRPKVSGEFEKIYGDRLKDHMDEVEKEVWERALDGVKVSDFVPILASAQPATMEDAYIPYVLPAIESISIKV